MCLDAEMVRQQTTVKIGCSLSFDVCTGCGAAWLDAGQLQQLELDHAGGVKAIERFAAKQHAEQLSQEEEERLTKQIAELPPPSDFLGGILDDFLRDPRILVGILAGLVITGLLIYFYFYITSSIPP
jgi:Zn-finger nucleic acid-binding protein